MTRIDFHFNATDKLSHCCRLVRKIYRAGQKVVVFNDDANGIASLDRALWTFSQLDFIPHVMAGDPLAAQTPVLLAAEAVDTAHHDILVNLATGSPSFFSSFERMIEVVGTDPDDRNRARERFRYYKDRGYPIETFDLAAAGN